MTLPTICAVDATQAPAAFFVTEDALFICSLQEVT